MFSLGLAFAGPVAVSLLLADLAIGVASRNMPQLNVLVLAMPIKMILAYAVLAIAVLGWGPLLDTGFALAATLLQLHG
jgi:flagellar biosynthetic protein FliR